MSDESQPSVKAPTLFRNYISFAGALIVAASLASIILLFLIELTKAAENPYLGIVTYVILPAFLFLELVIIVAGMLIERRRRRRSPESEITAYPKIDLNDPRQRRIAFSLVGISFIFIFMSAFGSYRAYEYSESVEFCGQTCHTVMKPEYVAFDATSHARIRYVDCHVGHGAESYARSKLNGARQLYSLAFNKYSSTGQSAQYFFRICFSKNAGQLNQAVELSKPARVIVPRLLSRRKFLTGSVVLSYTRKVVRSFELRTVRKNFQC